MYDTTNANLESYFTSPATEGFDASAFTQGNTALQDTAGFTTTQVLGDTTGFAQGTTSAFPGTTDANAFYGATTNTGFTTTGTTGAFGVATTTDEYPATTTGFTTADTTGLYGTTTDTTGFTTTDTTGLYGTTTDTTGFTTTDTTGLYGATTPVLPDATAYTTQGISSYDNGIVQNTTTTTTTTQYETTAGFPATTSVLPATTIPATTSVIPTTTPVIPATTSVVPQTTVVQSTTTSAIPQTTLVPQTVPVGSTVQTVQSTVPMAPGAVVQTTQNLPLQKGGKIIDEDFRRGRPIYDEYREDRYKGYRMGLVPSLVTYRQNLGFGLNNRDGIYGTRLNGLNTGIGLNRYNNGLALNGLNTGIGLNRYNNGLALNGLNTGLDRLGRGGSYDVYGRGVNPLFNRMGFNQINNRQVAGSIKDFL